MILKSFSLPKQLEEFRHILEQSVMEYMKITVVDEAPYLTSSKLAGLPYLPKGTSQPRDGAGKYMILLAQINFSEAAFPIPFPQGGMLQIFISPSTYQQGLELNGCVSPNHFKVRYYPEVTTEDFVTDFHYLRNASFQCHPLTSHCPIDRELSLTFSREMEPISATDYRLDRFIPMELAEHFTRSEQQPFDEVYLQHFSSAEHKIGGYPYFIDADPRASEVSLQKYDTLLLQIVSNDDQGIMWGDSGVVKFFIPRKNLEKCDFSDILFYIEDY
ncbi:MAG: YwqG family protein [Lysinibacillus sp.]